jgi:hypothetical protein
MMDRGPLVGKSRPFAAEVDAVQCAYRGLRLARPPWLGPLMGHKRSLVGVSGSSRPDML